ncbi:MAG TPA: hypothetical protein VMI54_03775 [Polyangiaceae bacterium]|nr:hypothetical protein [Polyangiaceae bacterium]
MTKQQVAQQRKHLEKAGAALDALSRDLEDSTGPDCPPVRAAWDALIALDRVLDAIEGGAR